MLNHITIMGRLTRDPELRRTGTGIAVASFTVAVDRDYSGKDSSEKKTDFIQCVAWRQTGEFVSKYFAKGRMIVVSGRLEIRDWTDKEGNKRSTAEINVDNAYFGDSKPQGGAQQPAAGGYAAPAAPSYGQSAGSGYAAPAAPSYGQAAGGGYAAPTVPSYGQPAGGGYAANPGNPASDFALLNDDDAQLPF